MPQIGKQGFNPYLHKPIPKHKIERAIQENDSMTKAAQSLHVAYNTFKKYAKQYDLWKPNPSNAGITRVRKFTWNGKKPLDKEIELQKELIKEFVKPQRCGGCGYSEYRKSDMLSPLVIHFIDGDVQNKKPSNIKFYCYNCYFINSDLKHRVHNPEIGNSFEEQEEITEEQITGDELAKELGDKLSDLFGKN